MAYIVEIKNPFDPIGEHKKTQGGDGLTIWQWLEQEYPGFQEFDRPTYCVLNGNPVKRDVWKTHALTERDIVNFITLPGDPVTALYVIVGLTIVAGVVVALNIPKIENPATQDTQEGDPVYTLRGRRNQVRLGDPIHVPYGRNRQFPPYAAEPYNQYRDNNQYLYQLFCLGQGEYQIESIMIEDTPIANFDEVEYQIVAPGEELTLFPDNVITSDEVGGIELFSPSETGGTGVYIEDSEGDTGLGIDPTGHYGYDVAGPFVANPTLTQTKRLEVDVALTRGLYKINDDTGNLTPLTITGVFEYREIDDDGDPVDSGGAWTTLLTFTKTLSTITPQRFTVGADVPLGRYEVRAYRTDNKDESTRAGHVLVWEGLRAFLPSTQDYGNITLFAVKSRATNNLNDKSANRFNCWTVRKLPVWDPDTNGGEWTEPTPTRSIVWAFCDVFRSQYGGRLADTYLDIDALVALNDTYTALEETFDWVFDAKTTVWDAVKTIGRVGRAVPMLNGSRVTLIRDEPKTIPTAMFNQENIVKDSFDWEIQLPSIDEFDGLEVEYTDPDTGKPETVICKLDDEDALNPEYVKLEGCSNRAQAYHWGMYVRAKKRYQRENLNFGTGLEGHIPSFGDLIQISHDVPRWGKGGYVKSVSGDEPNGVTPVDLTLELSEPVSFDDEPTGTVFKILLRKNDGSRLGPFTATAGADEFHVVISVLVWEDFYFDGIHERPLFFFGPADQEAVSAKVVGLEPAEDETVNVKSVLYDSRVFDYDEYVPPAIGNTTGGRPTRPARPSVAGLLVTASRNVPNEVIASWKPTDGAEYYIVQLSYDGTVWQTIGDRITDTSVAFQVLPRYLYVRAAAVNDGQGAWAYWTGDSPTEVTNIEIDNDATPNAVTDVTLTAGFGVIWIQWTNPTNAKIKNIHIYANTSNAQPGAPMFSVPAGQNWLAHDGLDDDSQWYYWIVVESIAGKFSAVAGPYTATTINGITLDHLIPGGLQPVEIVSVLPSSGNYQGRIVFLTTDDNVGGTFPKDKLYRWTSDSITTGKAYWTAAVPAVDVTGQLTNDQLAEIAAAKVSGQLTNDQLAGIAAAKLIGSVVDSQIADISAVKVTGTLSDSQIAALSAAKLTGQITETQITDSAISTAKLAAGSITTAKIAAGAVTANEIGANAITAAKIAAGAVETDKLAANSITTAKLAANAVTANEIAANAITTAKIAAGAVTANEIAANAVTATQISAGAVSTAKLAAGAVTADTIAANAITAAKIEAGAVTTAKLAAGAVTANELAADSVTAGKIAAAAITATAIGANEVIAQTANIKDGIITNAKIVSLLADKITTGTLAAMTLTAAKTQTDSAFFNSGSPANTMPSFCIERDSQSTEGNIGVGTHHYSIATINGWSVGTGYAKRFGKSTTAFTISTKSSFTISSTYTADVYIAYRINGGSWTDLATSARATAFDGGAELTDSVEISGLSGSDVIEFGIKIVVSGGTIYYGNSQQSVLWGNV